MIRTILLPIALALLVSACSAQSTPPQTLKEKLASVEPNQRTRTARNACLTEAEWRRDQLISYNTRHYGGKNARSNLPYMPDVERLKSICWEMTKLYDAKD